MCSKRSYDYLQERNYLRGKFPRFPGIFAKLAKLNPCEKPTGSQFAKLNPHKVFKKMARENISA